MKYPMMILALGLFAFAPLMPEATAGQLFAYTFTDGTLSVSGTLTANPNGDGSYTAVAGTATVTGGPETGSLSFVTDPNAPAYAIYASGGGHIDVYDDQLTPGSSPLISNAGLLFQFQNGYFLNLFSNSPFTGYTAEELTSTRSIAYASSTPGTFTLTPIPEPSSLAMMGIAGGLGLGYFARGRRRAIAA